MFLESGNKTECFGCEACVQACECHALTMEEDKEGFRYPVVHESDCIGCSKCLRVCPYVNKPHKNEDNKYAFGGYHLNPKTRFDSTSGGAFSAIAESYCDKNYVIFGAEAKGLNVFHSYVTDIREIWRFRKSKYSQSIIGFSYKKTRQFLKEGKKVLFSGTPCQIAGLLSFLGATDKTNLLTVEVVCEGVPSPLYVRKMDEDFYKKTGSRIESLDYRYTGTPFFSLKRFHNNKIKSEEGHRGKWDFEQMQIILALKKKAFIIDRWFNPFWSIWLQHLMSRPSCYKCEFTVKGRVADITLGDLWGVHLYCPELYGKNGGSSLIVCNTQKGKDIFHRATKEMHGHELKFEDALKYQSPMRKTIENNPKRSEFISDLQSEMDYIMINKKWAKRPTAKLLFQKYIWGNAQKIFVWNLKQRLTKSRDDERRS